MDIEQQVKYKLIRIYMVSVLPTMAASLLVALLLIIVGWTMVNHTVLLGWFGLHCLAFVALFMIVHDFKRNEEKYITSGWIRIISFCTLWVGLLWGGGCHRAY